MLIAKMSGNIRHPKPAEGQIAGSQPSDKPLASTPAEGLAVAPAAEQSAPAADEIPQRASSHQAVQGFVSAEAGSTALIRKTDVHTLPGSGKVGGIALMECVYERRVGFDVPQCLAVPPKKTTEILPTLEGDVEATIRGLDNFPKVVEKPAHLPLLLNCSLASWLPRHGDYYDVPDCYLRENCLIVAKIPLAHPGGMGP